MIKSQMKSLWKSLDWAKTANHKPQKKKPESHAVL